MEDGGGFDLLFEGEVAVEGFLIDNVDFDGDVVDRLVGQAAGQVLEVLQAGERDFFDGVFHYSLSIDESSFEYLEKSPIEQQIFNCSPI